MRNVNLNLKEFLFNVTQLSIANDCPKVKQETVETKMSIFVAKSSKEAKSFGKLLKTLQSQSAEDGFSNPKFLEIFTSSKNPKMKYHGLLKDLLSNKFHIDTFKEFVHNQRIAIDFRKAKKSEIHEVKMKHNEYVKHKEEELSQLLRNREFSNQLHPMPADVIEQYNDKYSDKFAINGVKTIDFANMHRKFVRFDISINTTRHETAFIVTNLLNKLFEYGNDKKHAWNIVVSLANLDMPNQLINQCVLSNQVHAEETKNMLFNIKVASCLRMLNPSERQSIEYFSQFSSNLFEIMTQITKRDAFNGELTPQEQRNINMDLVNQYLAKDVELQQMKTLSKEKFRSIKSKLKILLQQYQEYENVKKEDWDFLMANEKVSQEIIDLVYKFDNFADMEKQKYQNKIDLTFTDFTN